MANKKRTFSNFKKVAPDRLIDSLEIRDIEINDNRSNIWTPGDIYELYDILQVGLDGTPERIDETVDIYDLAKYSAKIGIPKKEFRNISAVQFFRTHSPNLLETLIEWAWDEQ